MLSNYSVKKPYTVVVAVIIVLILGVVAFTGMQLDLLPNINLPYAIVMTSYTGASPEEVETMVTKPLEQAMSTVSNIKKVTSVSSENSSMVILEFNQDTDMDSAANEIREKIDLVTPYWEDDNIGAPMIMQLNPDMIPVVVASVDMEGMDMGELSSFVNDKILPQLESVEGVASVTAYGLAEDEIDVTIDDDLIDDVNEAIGASINGDISKAKAMLSAARSQIEAAYGTLDETVAENSEKLDDAEAQITTGLATLNDTKAQLTTTIAGLNDQKETLNEAVATLTAEKSDLESQIKEYTDQGQTAPSTLTDQLATVSNELGEKQTALDTLNDSLTEANGSLDDVESQIAALESQQEEVDSSRAAMADQADSAKSQLDSGLSEIDSQTAQLASAASAAKDKADIKAYITKDMISGILAAQNFSMPAGTLDAEEGAYPVKVGEELASIDDIKDLLLFELNIGGVDDIRVKDVALVTMAAANGDTYTKVNGNNGILLSFEKQSNYSASEVSENINATMASLESEYDGLNCYNFMDQGEYIHLLINSVLQNLIMGAVLAIFILILCLKDIRPTAIIAVSIPASVLFALVMMYFTGVTLNLISMSGLALGVGMLVDNSIVVIENIYRMRREGKPAKEAAVEGAKQVAGAITASTLTTISVFVPIAFTHGLSKELFMDMGLTIGFSLIASLIVALTVVPSMASRILKGDTDKQSKVFEWMKLKYEVGVRWVLKKRGFTMIGITLLLIISVVLCCSRGFSFMPDYKTTELTATLTTENDDMTESDFYAAADAVSEAALKLDGVSGIGGMSSNADTSYAAMGGSGLSVSLYLVLDENAPAQSEDLQKALSAVAAKHDCEINVDNSTDFSSYLGGSGVTLTVKGDDLTDMATFTKVLGADVAKVDGIEKVSSDMENATSQLMVTVDKDEAMKAGLTVAQVYQAVAAGIATDDAATTVSINGSEYSVFVIDGSEAKMSIDDVADIVVDEDDDVTVGDIAEVSVEDSPSSIYRSDQQRYMTISATVSDGYATSKVSSAVEKLVDSYDIPSGISVEVGGESSSVSDYMTDLGKAIALAIVLMYLIMVAQFQSLRSPFIVMFTVPLAFTGGFLLLYLCGFDVSVIALLGLLVLSGVVVNNGIVLVDYVNRLVDDGMDVTEALVLGGKTRLRPIMMTAVTTVLGLVTMALGLGDGTEMIQPMAIVVIGGLTYATIMTLFVVPVMYDLMHRKRMRKKKAAKKALAEMTSEPVLFDPTATEPELFEPTETNDPEHDAYPEEDTDAGRDQR